jgi:hypothetical protein
MTDERALLPLAALLVAASGCLPAETRARPGTLALSVAATFDSSESFESDDGWTVSLDRTYAHVGRVELGGSDCDAYSEASYSRLLDLSSDEPQRLSLLYGLGRCSFSFAVGPPRWNTVVGEAVPAEVEERFRTPGSDGATEGGVSLYVEGRASRKEKIVRFAWPLRARLALDDCQWGEPAAPVALSSGVEQAAELRLDALQLLRDQTGALRFDPFAFAAESAATPDEELSLDELLVAPGAAAETLFHELYYARLPRIAGVTGGACTARVESCGGGGCDD